ncbi:Bax1-I domain-containing protein [Cephalotus follicularis]|uniref:Bax1-I domain-containing protein n=1 Tax=Cephalotus follicularis TaxID=3775 RepID=A0A1Q3BI50_CEPFO|nr:Bax1-I domain-containing protein [Cephalotus follicularis]
MHLLIPYIYIYPQISYFHYFFNIPIFPRSFFGIFSFFLAHQTMDAFSSYFDSQSRTSWSYESLKNFRQISPVVQNHLKQVYLTVCFALVASAAGAYLHILYNIGGLLTTLACVGCIVWMLSTPPYEEQKRVNLLMASALFEGASVGPLIDLAIEVDPRILISAFVGTAVAFACFSGAAIVAKRREYLYLGGLLSSGLSMLMWLHFASSLFGGSTAIFKFELYFGLLVFVGYMVVDTQEIIERAHLGDLDYVKHALTLFTDFVAVFVRILIIMLKNSVEKNEKKKKRRD